MTSTAANGGTVMWHHLQDRGFLDVNALARHTAYLHTPLRLYAHDGVVLFAALLLVSWWLARGADRRTMAAALWAPVGALVALGLNQPVVHAVGEARPYAVFPHALVLVSRSQDASFPSDHAVMAGAVAVGILLTHRRLGLIAAGAALLMAFTRVYVGAHFPLDVVAGLVLGGLVTLLGHRLFAGVIARLLEVVERTPLRPLATSAPRARAAEPVAG